MKSVQCNNEHDWLAVAEEQLLVAIDLYQKGISYYSALTLAGAAEEILGAEIRDNRGQSNALELMVEHVSNLLTEEELRVLGGKRAACSTLNEARNFLKHRTDEVAIFFNAKAESWELLQRAVDNFLALKPVMEGPIFEFKFEQDPRD